MTNIFTKKPKRTEVEPKNFTEEDWEMLDAIMLFMKYAIQTSPNLAGVLLEPCFFISKLFTNSGRSLPTGDVSIASTGPDRVKGSLDSLSELTKGRI